jgi:predicted nucleic acid-binding protein
MTELLVRSYRASDEDSVSKIFDLLLTYPNLEWIAPNLEIADTAAWLRAVHRLEIPDALHAATAIQSGATGLVTNDAIFERVPQFETLLLDSLL